MGMVEETHTNGTFKEYIAIQLDHVQQILGTLQAAEVDTECWIDALNKGLVTIAKDGLTQINTKQTILCDNAAAIFRANTTFGHGIKHYTTTD
eukprot:9308489-Ditylum_brightwellii.AAC.2